MILKQKIIKLVRLSATKDVRDIGFSFSCISIGTGSLIRIKYLVSQPSILANCLLVFLLQQGLDHEQVEDIGLLAILLLVIGLARAFSQLRLLSTETILGPETDKTVWPG